MTDPTGTGRSRRAWATAQPTTVRLEEAVGFAIPRQIQQYLRDLPPRPGWPGPPEGPLSDETVRAHRPTRHSPVRVAGEPASRHGRLLRHEEPLIDWERDGVRVEVFLGTASRGLSLGYRISEITPGRERDVVFCGVRRTLPSLDGDPVDDTIRHVVLTVIGRALHDDTVTERQHAFVRRHRAVIGAVVARPPDHPFPDGTRVVAHKSDPARRATGTVLVAVDDADGHGYLWRPDAADLPGHPWRDQPTWALRAHPDDLRPTLAVPEALDSAFLTTGAQVATIDDPRFATGTVLRAFADGGAPRYEIEPHDVPLPPVVLDADDLVPLRGTAWPTVEVLLAARATAGLSPQAGEMLVTARETAIVLATPDGPDVLTAPGRRQTNPALDPGQHTRPTPVPEHLLTPARRTPTLTWTGDGTIRVDDPGHGRLDVGEELFNAAMRHPPAELDAMLARRPWLATSPDQPAFVAAALAARYAARDVLRVPALEPGPPTRPGAGDRPVDLPAGASPTAAGPSDIPGGEPAAEAEPLPPSPATDPDLAGPDPSPDPGL
ncbi:hypothetical protein I6A84_10050 [Frankia sp. CNm7]|uniref:Uncharacterized protein n=1 Tax=Frankia nepalensis TaxID=1836974 RepID=A0A937ULM5_9ACTN|nr:hypothetical protein [Frankia nepalensis]MBL7498777.1 hypothetical protein [Frankia nepalensis]MBL7508359.1 hypothetical protein [Frankia nepalensis]MBL7518443.1 hypothetical protein [Frankia nepalensis]MBL7626188.1 hypothetical protein [Frankia nepalensis]